MIGGTRVAAPGESSERGASEARDARSFPAAFAASLPQARRLRRGCGGQRWGAASPTSSCCPPVPLPAAGSASAEEVNRVGGAAPLPRRGFLAASESRCQDAQRVGPFSTGSAFPCPAPAPKALLEAKLYCRRAPRAVARGAGRAVPGAAGPCVPAAGPGTRCSRESWQRPAPLQLLRAGGEQVVVITEQRRRGPWPPALGAGSASCSRVPCPILSRGLFK